MTRSFVGWGAGAEPSSTVALLARSLEILSGYCEKAILFTEAKGLEPTALARARILPEDPPLGAQIAGLVDFIVRAGEVASGASPPVLLSAGTSFAELRQRAALARQFLSSLSLVRAKDGAFRGDGARGDPDVPRSGDDDLFNDVVPRVLTEMANIHNTLLVHGVLLAPPTFLYLPEEFRLTLDVH